MRLKFCIQLTEVVWQPVTRMAGLRHWVKSNISRFCLSSRAPLPQMLPCDRKLLGKCRGVITYICVSGVDNFGDVPFLDGKEGHYAPTPKKSQEEEEAEAVCKAPLGDGILAAVFVGLPIVSIFVPLKTFGTMTKLRIMTS